jgi:small subunit ribosomal protein S16
MLTIKLSRFGKKKQPTYRILVMEKSKDPWGDYLENLGHYDPRTKVAELNADRIKYWISKGAETTDSINNLLITNKIIEGKKRSVTRISNTRREKMAKEQPKKTAKGPEPAEGQAAPAETPAPSA